MKLKYLLAATLMTITIGVTGCGQKPSEDAAKSSEETSSTAKVLEMKGEDLAKIESDKKEKEKYLVVDVRDSKEYGEGHLKFAINMPIDTFEKDSESIADFKDKDVVLYCNSGKKSGDAAKILIDKGFTKVYNAQGVKDFKYDLVTFSSVLGPQFQKDIDEGKASFIIDSRDEKDFKDKTFKNAVNILPDTFDQEEGKLPKDKNEAIYVFCYTGNKSAEIAGKLTEKGYKNVVNAIDGAKEFDYKFQ
ncbi:rhodanese-like domain-containing protein [Peptostreptococcus faecalis]|uniref:rhodanese-like domain-containing protein n=1 Tax=Peptostreptococcus faecalis TaxID=2045015 RepID=UPI000C7A4024|nr:rhodanese-like domain-containing protein [Peptostreptococcus faecalis]